MTERDLFDAALDVPAADRGRFLDERCGGDAGLRRRVDGLLAAHAISGGFLDVPPGQTRTAGASGSVADDQSLRQLLTPSDRAGALGRLAHYDVLEVLGRGGFGIVVKAFDTTLQRVVAVKFLDPLLAGTSPPRQRFLREARAAARVSHEHVVRVHAVEEQPVPYLVMEYVGGGTLQDHLDATGPLPPAEVARLGRQIALGLAAAHAQGLIHRDVKPANVLLAAGVVRQARLTDFGLARAADDASLTASGVIAGTPLYMAPEQARGEALDPRADLFSLGSVLYTLTTGRPPFRAAGTLAVLKRVAEDKPRPPGEVIEGVPPGLAAVIDRLLAKRPTDRYPTAQDAADALDRCLTAAPQARPRDPSRRAVAAAVVLLVVAGGVWAALAERNRPPSAELVSPTEPKTLPVASSPTGGLVVTSPLDDDRPGTLRWAVSEANVRHGEDVITFDPGTFATPQVISLTAGPLTFLDPDRTTVVGPPAGVTLTGGYRTRVVEVGRGFGQAAAPAAARLVGLVLAHGRAAKTGPRQGEEGIGGGLLCWESAHLALDGCTVRDCSAESCGGSVFNFRGVVTLMNCTVARGQGEGEGQPVGGVRGYGGSTTAVHCTFVGNRGGIRITDSGRVRAVNCLFADNKGGGLVVFTEPDAVVATGNLFDDESGGGRFGPILQAVGVGPLGRHGGPTETVPLLTGSPAMAAGELVPDVTVDQRGRPRATAGRVDIGAFEANP